MTATSAPTSTPPRGQRHRKRKAKRGIGDATRCAACGRRLLGLDAHSATHHGLCYKCATGRETEPHHIWGVANSTATIEIPSNEHRILDGLKAERCGELKKPRADPLHQLAAAIATIGEGINYFADYARQNGWPEWVANIAAVFARAAKSGAHYLLCLAAALNRRFGQDWAAALDMPSWRPPGTDE